MARTTKGRIFTRGKHNYFFLQYYVKGKQFVVPLKDEQDNNITKARDAKKAAAIILNPLVVNDEKARLEKVSEALQTAEQKAEAAELEAANSKAAISKGWELFYSCPKRPKTCRKYPIEEIPNETTTARYRAIYRKFAAWMKKNHRTTLLLADVTEAQALEFIEQIKKQGASGTVNKHIQFMKCFYDTIIAAGKISCKNPFTEIEREENNFNSRKPLTIQQIANLLDTAAGEMKTLIALGYFAGLRLGDAATLQWSEVDLIRGIIERVPRKTASRTKAVVKIGIAPLLAGLLAETPANARKGYVLPEMGTLYDTGKSYLVSNRITAHFEKQGIQTKAPGTGYRSQYVGKEKVYIPSPRAIVLYNFHSLRYSYISHAAERGIPQAIIQRNAGHANPQMTESYIKISDQEAKRHAAKLQLPGADQPNTGTDEDERAELRKLVDTLNIEQIRNILAGLR